MSQIHISPVGTKAQVTLPKAVRALLGVKEKEDMVGFIIEGKKVALTRIEPVPSSDPFTNEEWKKIEKLATRKPVATFNTSKESIQYLRKMLSSK